MNQPATEDESVAGNLRTREVIIVGGGIAGLSAAIYLGRARRDTLVIDSGKSMARWEPDVQNYLGFPKGVSGEELLARGCAQARTYEVEFVTDEIVAASREEDTFVLRSRERAYRCRRVLIATGIFHVPPEINGASTGLSTAGRYG